MAAMRGPRLQVGSAQWIAEERASALEITRAEVEEFSYSARNELDWLNEHMAGIFDENETNFAETFKTPGKLRGKTPRTARKANALEMRVPLSDVFAANPNGPTNIASQANRMQSPQTHVHAARNSPSPVKPASARKATSPPKQAAPATAPQDSGYYGSQDVGPVDIHMDPEADDVQDTQQAADHAPCHTTTVPLRDSPTRAAVMESPEKTFQTAREEQTTRVAAEVAATTGTSCPADTPGELPEDERMDVQPTSPSVAAPPDVDTMETEEQSQAVHAVHAAQHSDDARSASDGSSPIRPVVRKSSLNFASLPAREPLTAGKSIGARVSRTSHLDHIRTSYYNRPTGGKSLGNLGKLERDEDADRNEMDVDEEPPARAAEQSTVALSHTKTYTQRLQDQINMLGKPQSNGAGQSRPRSSVQSSQQPKAAAPKSPSPVRKPTLQTTPGAFPADDEDGDEDDDWIEPPAAMPGAAEARPALPKSHSTDVMEGIQGKDTIGQDDFTPSTDELESDASLTGRPEHSASAQGHAKSTSVPIVQTTHSAADPELLSLKKAISVSNPDLLAVSETEVLHTPSKSPSRSFRESPLKQVKNKLSSILKSSRGLLASSAALSAEGKSFMISPSGSRLGLHAAVSPESVAPKPAAESHSPQAVAGQAEGSPTRPVARRTRASTEWEKEEKRREKEARRMEEQNEKLEKAREKEREKALIFSREREKIAAMERQITMKAAEDKAKAKETPKPTRSSPRKGKATEEGEQKAADRDVEVEDAPPAAPLPSAAWSVGPGQAIRTKDLKRPVKPAKETQAKAKQAPMVIRVNTGSQHSQYHTSTTRLSTASHDTAGPSSSQSQHQLVSKPSKASLHAKPSTQSIRSNASVGRPRALDLAAKKKEQDEREAQRRREAKAKMERKRAAAQEEQRRQEQWRRQEAEQQKQGREPQNEGKTPAQRKAAVERAKQTRAPPPAARPQPSGRPDSVAAQERVVSAASSARGDEQTARPQPRMTSNLHRSQDESSRPVNAVLSNTSKAGTKRPLGPERSDDGHAKRPPSRGGPAYQANEAKRRRTSDALDGEAEAGNGRNIKGPPVRPSGGVKKDLPSKSLYGYTNAPHSATRDLFKATVTAQHNSQTKAAHPLDMAQISKGTIPFAPNPNAAHKTPARPGAYNGAKSAAKSAARSSPRFQNGESIELPEIQTDDEDDDEASGTGVAAWADSPDLRRALMRQETMDPSHIFGPPAPLNMEEVFNRSKDRWHKFRSRTSSANWSGVDRLTEEDIRKDLAARDKLRRDGGWSYEMSRDMV